RFGAARAHLHAEAALMLSTAETAPARYESMNMAALNLEDLLRASQNGVLDISAHARALPVDFIIETPRSGRPGLLRRHPWLEAAAHGGPAAGWRIHFTAWGFPARFEPLSEKPAAEQVTWVRPWTGLHTWRTRQMLTGQGASAQIGPRGEVLLGLVFAADGGTPEPLR
ncbi:MAG TPA: hypothetical protein PK490_20645, partial [Prosthecobacter sp.]|nr:hypothetical protein [Prosthecobacter sp.]